MCTKHEWIWRPGKRTCKWNSKYLKSCSCLNHSGWHLFYKQLIVHMYIIIEVVVIVIRVEIKWDLWWWHAINYQKRTTAMPCASATRDDDDSHHIDDTLKTILSSLYCTRMCVSDRMECSICRWINDADYILYKFHARSMWKSDASQINTHTHTLYTGVYGSRVIKHYICCGAIATNEC